MSDKPTQEEERKRVIAVIVEAFRNVRREGGITIHEADAIDAYGCYEDPAIARERDDETFWQYVPGDKIEKLSEVFPFLDDKGFRFYIPAYMKWTLENLRSGGNSCGSTVYSLSANNKKKFVIFNAAQSAAILDFLTFMATYEDDGDAKKAIERYWGKLRREARKT
jgi:hypothetical protein